MAKKKVVCSFDYEYDRKYYYLLEAWNDNDNIDFSINDCTPSEIQTESVSKIKQCTTVNTLDTICCVILTEISIYAY